MDFLCNECAKSSAKEVDLVIHQSRAHDKRHFSCFARCVRKTSLGKTSTETTWESTTRRRKLPKNPHMFILPLRNTIQTYVHLALTKHHANGTSSNMSRHMTKKRFMGHPSSALNVENHFLPKEIWQNTWKFTSLYFHLICLVILLWLATY